MKKFILIFLAAICVAGVVALGYLVFNAKTIATVEIEGQMQTIYVAGQDIDFENAKLSPPPALTALAADVSFAYFSSSLT